MNNSIKLVRNLALKKHLVPCVATIGNFDGLHQGHRKIIEQVVALAKQQQGIATVITFEPAPLSFLKPELNILRLTSISEKIRILKQWGVEQVICLRFNDALSKLSAAEFIQTILCDALQLKTLIVGEDFRFGHKQSGNVELLKTVGQQCGFKVQAISLVETQSSRISSTAVREALLGGDCARVSALLGRHYSVTKRVIRGAKRGQQWGFPTANLPLSAKQILFKGVFITRVSVDNLHYWAVTNVGTRPSVDGKHYLIESHLLNFNNDLYEKRITVEFIHKIRDEKRFDNVDALRAQIQLDIQHATEWTEHSNHAVLT